MKHLPFQIFTFAILVILIVPLLVQDGMFLDGLLYTSVAKNQAEGFGSFWFPMFSETWDKNGVHSFHEHPPLIFGIQSLFFKFLGSGIWVERFYSFFTALMAAWLIHLNWKIIIRKDSPLVKMSWLPVLLWIIIPVCFWSYQNNMQENTMGIFCLAASYFCFKYYFQKPTILYLIWSGCFIFLATFSKGVPGLFPLAIPFLYWLSFRKITFVKMVTHSSILAFLVILIYSLLMFYEPAKENLSFYFESRLLGRIELDPNVNYRWFILWRLFQELLPSLFLTALIFVFLKFKSFSFQLKNEEKRMSLFLLLVGLSGTLPLMLTMVQNGFYMVHALPFFGLGLGMLIAPSFLSFYKNINKDHFSFKIFRIFSFTLLLVGITLSISKIGKTKIDHEKLHDVYLLKNILPEKSTISLEESIQVDYNLEAYLMRNSNISINNKLEENYFIVEKKKKNFELEGFKKLETSLVRYDLWEKNDFYL